ncbi:hypothetical protein TSOC_004848 [Tetrabaena socialis]|uniref:Uncharacterized protein n=1 Tax=Tetrabaena socialis TaxID=47790 RepID=A0A2J8A7U6_9CHLO|nr:hypothetical protein TSOC_004848 [Tetrabaena socialis]|eukprot:PNH08591.1 hypothetical protein TSOC_004848 [Tetrabaena socialis]
MFGHVARAARPAVAAAAVAAAAQGSVHARAPPASAQGAARQSAFNKIVDRDEGWLLAELQDEVVVFKPYDKEEVDDAASVVMSLWGGRCVREALSDGCVVLGHGLEEDEREHISALRKCAALYLRKRAN